METLAFGMCFATGLVSGAFIVLNHRYGIFRLCVGIAMRSPCAVRIPLLRFFFKSDTSKDRSADHHEMWITKSGRREFRYTAFGRKYIVSCHADKTNRKPCNIVSAIATGKDGRVWEVTQDVEERMGPQGDCHGIGGISIDWFDDAERLFIETLDSEFTITRTP
jgi:hypothetical protein